MADKQGMLKKNADDGLFADGDPLAELARIVNFDGLGDIRPRQKPVRREPEFNLEDELLKEFEQFEAPVVTERHFEEAPPVLPDVEPAVTNSAPAYAQEPEFEETFSTYSEDVDASLQYEVAPEAEGASPNYAADLDHLTVAEPVSIDEAPSIAATTGRVEPLFADVEPQAIVQAPHPVFELEDEIMREFAAFDARRAPRAEEDTQPVSDFPLSPVPDYSMTSEAEHLPVAAVELDIDALPVEQKPFDAHIENGVIEETLAEDENTDASAPAIELVTEEPPHFEADRDADRDWGASYDVEAPDSSLFSNQPQASDISFEEPVEPVAESQAFASGDASYEPQHPARDVYHDPLLNDVERYPVSTPPGARWSRQTSFGTRVEQPSIVSAPPPEPEVATEEPSAEAQDAAPPALLSADIEPFDEGAFELDLSELELDLIEMEAESEIAQSSVAAEPDVTASPEAMQELVSAEVSGPLTDEPVSASTQMGGQTDDYSTLPFDPTQVTTEEEPLEAIADLDVPEIPKPEQEPHHPVQPDYDIDIDTDIAHLFTPRADQAALRPVSARAALAVAAQSPAATSPANEPDEFERALEEDFRRSLNEKNVAGQPDRVALTPQAFEESQRERSGGRRVLVIAVSVAAVVMLGGAGVYAYMRQGPSLIAGAGEPKVILADKDPIKIVPENKGGQTVPNQDKAVYDSVTGEGPATEKQNRLVTSNEEPVDVVQRTLMPEAIPMDDEGEQGAAGPMATATEDTTDTRLLPDGSAAGNMTKSEKVVSGVAPRKVRTMIVRGDGTLVPRDEPEAIEGAATGDQSQLQPDAGAAQSGVTTATEVPERLDAGSAQETATADSTAAQDDIAAAIKSGSDIQPTDSGTAPSDGAQQSAATTDEAEQPQVGETEIKTGSDPAPLTGAASNDAASDSANEPDTALQQAAQAKVESTQDTAPVRTVTTTTFSSDRTPVPEARPVDQQVNVVGTVTDEGNVRPADSSANDQVASNQTAAESLVNTPAQTQGAGGYVIQIASLPSEAEAQSSYNKLAVKFAGVIGGRGVDIKRAEIKNKGTYYRVRIPAGSKQEAAELCARYKSAGGSCLVSK